MQLEYRADGAHISGYVNVTEKKSRPVMTPHGRVVEEIEPRAFEEAIHRAGNITLTVDHDSGHVYAETQKGTLKLYANRDELYGIMDSAQSYIISYTGLSRGELDNYPGAVGCQSGNHIPA